MQHRAILVPLDGSELAERALGPARQLARSIGAALVLVRVAPKRAPEERVLQAGEIEAAERYLFVVADRLRETGAIVLAEAVAGEPAEAILGLATLWRAELIALATHGRGGLGRLIHGSVADAVIRGAGVPVLLIPARGDGVPTLHGDAVVVAVDGSAFAERICFFGGEGQAPPLPRRRARVSPPGGQPAPAGASAGAGRRLRRGGGGGGGTPCGRGG
jgi:nucleotide-binding universal stress UspA family protein